MRKYLKIAQNWWKFIENQLFLPHFWDKIFNHFSRFSRKKHHFLTFSLVFSGFYRGNLIVKGGTLRGIFSDFLWQNSETIFVTKFFSRTRIGVWCVVCGLCIAMHSLGLCSAVIDLNPAPHLSSPAPLGLDGQQPSWWWLLPIKVLGLWSHNIVRWYLHTTSDLTTTASQLSNREPLFHAAKTP